MIFRHQSFSKTLEWTEDIHFCELVIESPKLLRQVLRDFSIVDEVGQVCISDNDVTLNFDKDCDVIFNPLKLDFNNRRAMATLLKLLVKASLSENFYLETSKFKTHIIKYLGELVDSESFNFEVTTDEFGIDAIAKAVSLHIVGDEDDFVELLTDYMAMMAELASIKIFIFINLRSLLSDEELGRLRHNLSNHQLDILTIENYDLGTLEGVPRIVIDKDLCEI